MRAATVSVLDCSSARRESRRASSALPAARPSLDREASRAALGARSATRCATRCYRRVSWRERERERERLVRAESTCACARARRGTVQRAHAGGGEWEERRGKGSRAREGRRRTELRALAAQALRGVRRAQGGILLFPLDARAMALDYFGGCGVRRLQRFALRGECALRLGVPVEGALVPVCAAVCHAADFAARRRFRR